MIMMPVFLDRHDAPFYTLPKIGVCEDFNPCTKGNNDFPHSAEDVDVPGRISHEV